MDAMKPWYLSKTIWASFVSIAAALGGIIGVPVDAVDQSALADTMVEAVAALAGLIALWGRISATSRIARR